MFSVGFSPLLGIFDGIINWFNDWIINYVVKNLFYYLDIWLGSLIYRAIVVGVGKVGDICMLIFKKFAGISDVGVNIDGQTTSGDIVMTLLQSRTVTNLFWSMILVAVVILLIATFAGVIKTEFAKDGNNNKRKVIKNAFRGLANFVIVPVVCLFGVFVGNIILQAIHGATKTNQTTSIAGQCLVIGGYNVNRARKSQKIGEWGKYIVKSGNEKEFYWGQDRSFGSYLVGQDDSNYTNNISKGWGNFGIFYDDDKSAVNARTAAEKIDAAFASNYVLTVPDCSTSQRTIDILHVMGGYIGTITHTMVTTGGGTMDPTSTMIMNGEVIGGAADNDSWGDLAVALNGHGTFEPGWQISFSPYNIGLVAYYYDLTFSGFEYLTSSIALIYFCFVMLVTAVGLIKRLFTLSILFIISPGVCALYPLDEGKALEKWRGAFIKDTLAAYSTVVCANIFFSILPIFLSINLFTTPSELGVLAMIPGGLQVANRFARLLIVIGALLFFKNATKQVAEIIGGADAFSEGVAPAKKLGQVAGLGAGTIATAAVGAVSAVKGIAGKAKETRAAKRSAKMNTDAAARDKALEEQQGFIANNVDDSKAKPESPSGSSNDNSMNISENKSTPKHVDVNNSNIAENSKAMNQKTNDSGSKLSSEDNSNQHKEPASFNDQVNKAVANYKQNKALAKAVEKKVTSRTGRFVSGTIESIKNIVTGKGNISDSFNAARKGSQKYQKEHGKLVESIMKSTKFESDPKIEAKIKKAEQKQIKSEYKDFKRREKIEGLQKDLKDIEESKKQAEKKLDNLEKEYDMYSGVKGNGEDWEKAVSDGIEKQKRLLKEYSDDIEKINKKIEKNTNKNKK